MFRPTTTVSILGGTSEDIYGDLVDNATVLSSGIPAAIMERRERIFLPNTLEPRTVHYYTCRLLYGTSISAEDNQIKDEQTGAIYAIENITGLQSPVKRQPLRLDMRRVLGDQSAEEA